MDRSRLTFLLLSLAVMLPIVTGALMARGDDESDDSLFKYLSVFQDVLRLVRQAYVEEISIDELMEGALDGTSDALDPFSTYVPAEAVDDYLAALEIGSSHSGMTVAKDNGIVYLISVDNGSPATVAELRPGDILTSIDGEPTRQMALWRVQKVLAGSPGTVLQLELLREGASQEVELTLGTFERSLVEIAEHQEVPLLRLDTIGPGTAAAVETALAELDEARAGQAQAGGLIIDLRETVSLDTESAFEVGKLFAEGELGSLTTVDGVVDSFATEGPPAWGGDLVVLLGRGSIGGAEILAKILRESAGAKLVGQYSFGYAGRLSLMPLTSGAQFRLTDAFYAGPDGEPISEGIEPDVEVSVRTRSFAEKDIEIEELTLQRALEVLQNGDELSEAA